MKKLKKYAGFLIKVEDTKNIEPNAKKYLSKLAKAGLIKKVKMELVLVSRRY